MAKNIRRILAMVMVMCMFASTLPMQALAAESETTTETITNGDLTTEITTTTTTTTDEVTGNTTVTVEIQQSTSGKNAEGSDVAGNVFSTTTTVTDSDKKVVESNSKCESTTASTTEANGVSTSVIIVDGSESATGINGEDPKDVTVAVPKTNIDNPETEENENKNTVPFGNPVGTQTTTGDVKEDENDTHYDYTTSTVTQQGSVTVTTTEVKVEENIETEITDLKYVKSETNPDDANDLVHAGDAAPEEYLPGYTGETMIPEGVEGYDYVYVGSGNTSKLVPAIVFDAPLTDEQKVEQFGEGAYIGKSYRSYYVGCLKEEDRNRIAYTEDGSYVTDENGFILDVDGNRILKEERVAIGPNGETIYLHRFDNYNNNLKVEGWYEDGKWVKEMNGNDQYVAVWAGPQQFVLVDSNGNPITTYCADFSTPTQNAFGYNVENLEDATYYSDKEAELIRSIALNGYWGTVGNETDANGNVVVDNQGNPVPKVGSLEAMKQILLASGDFTKEELESLTDGVALTATQMAIWSCSNKMSGIKFVNSHYSNWGVGNVPDHKEDEVKLLFKIYDYLTALAPTEVENTTADTIINTDNFVGDMSVTVVKKAEDHANNQDTNNTNDAYVTNLTFALVVKPSTENGDDLVVSVVDASGKEIASGRIAGEAKEGENILVPDANGNYCFEGITMIEGEQNFKLNLQGIQNLKEGVYLYSSEVRTSETDPDMSSQTLVGMAGGNRGVNVSMEIKFELNVDEGIVATERVWHSESDPIKYFPNQPTPIGDEPVPMVFRLNNQNNLQEIPEEPVPLASPVITGDGSGLWVTVILLSIFAMAAFNLCDKKRQHEFF